MAHFADLTPYSYISRLAETNVLNIGWLDNRHSFLQGEVPEAVLAKLFAICSKPVNLTRGAHSCQLCPHQWGHVSERDGIKIADASGEIRIKGLNGIQYASPTMIYHYMKEHRYKPPQEFIDAVAKTEVQSESAAPAERSSQSPSQAGAGASAGAEEEGLQ